MSFNSSPGYTPGAAYELARPSMLFNGVTYSRGEIIPVDEIPAYRVQQLLECRYIKPAAVKMDQVKAAQTLAAASAMEARRKTLSGK